MTETQGTESNDTIPTIQIEYRNLEGQYFTQWRIDLLEDLLNTIVFAYESVPLVEVQNVKIWYDSRQDFHMLEFSASGLLFTIRLYKVFSLNINGADHWIGCPQSELGRMAFEIRKICRSGKVV